ncbi:MAG: hypothetical protein E2O29_02060 [Deltaproteobacteria bacterium]|nr:MAG: hypothetical protein E2O29_02060 [Deltaproteobacteria bacterium]
MEYFVVEEQDLDWQPVIRRFVTESVENGLLDYVERPQDLGKIGKAVTLSSKSMGSGFASVRGLFNAWYNLKAHGKIK